MPNPSPPDALVALDAPKRVTPSTSPEPFASQMQGREKRTLGDLFGLTNFGVNLTQLAPSAVSSLRHAHTTQDEFIYIFEGHPTLHTDEGRTRLSPCMCAGFKAGTGNGHRLLEMGGRSPGDSVIDPGDDTKAVLVDGKWFFSN